MIIVKHRKSFFVLTGIIVALALGSLMFFGLHLGTDFTGGTLAEVRYVGERPDPKTLSVSLNANNLGAYSLREAGPDSYILRAGALSNETRGNLADMFSVEGKYHATVDRLTEV